MSYTHCRQGNSARLPHLPGRRLLYCRQPVAWCVVAWLKKLDGDAFAFEQQAKQLRDTVLTTKRLTAEVRALSEEARTQTQNILGKLSKER